MKKICADCKWCERPGDQFARCFSPRQKPDEVTGRKEGFCSIFRLPFFFFWGDCGPQARWFEPK